MKVKQVGLESTQNNLNLSPQEYNQTKPKDEKSDDLKLDSQKYRKIVMPSYYGGRWEVRVLTNNTSLIKNKNSKVGKRNRRKKKKRKNNKK